jgi:hypothetical protein
VQAIGRQPPRAPDGAPVHYERHRPEQTTLYRLIQQHAATLFAQAEAEACAELPQFVKDELDDFLECGIFAHGFLRLRCGVCGHDKLVAFSCKRRGLCPSCGARRMAQTAAHLVDRVIPHVPVRQGVGGGDRAPHRPGSPTSTQTDPNTYTLFNAMAVRTGNVVAVPEPLTGAMMLVGLGAMVAAGRSPAPRRRTPHQPGRDIRS